MLDMPHGGSVWFDHPCKNASLNLQCLSPQSGSYPHEPLFFFSLDTLGRLTFISENLWPNLSASTSTTIPV